MNITVSLFGQIASFILLIWFVNKVLWGPMSAMLEDRQKRIADGLAAGEKGKAELEDAKKQAGLTAEQAKSQAGDMLMQAEKRASEIVEEAKNDARAEAKRLVAASKAEIEQEINRAKEHLRAQVVTIALSGAAKILGAEVDEKKHAAVLDDLVKQI